MKGAATGTCCSSCCKITTKQFDVGVCVGVCFRTFHLQQFELQQRFSFDANICILKPALVWGRRRAHIRLKTRRIQMTTNCGCKQPGENISVCVPPPRRVNRCLSSALLTTLGNKRSHGYLLWVMLKKPSGSDLIKYPSPLAQLAERTCIFTPSLSTFSSLSSTNALITPSSFPLSCLKTQTVIDLRRCDHLFLALLR